MGATNVGLEPTRGLLFIAGFGDGSRGNEGNKFCSLHSIVLVFL